MKTCRLAKVHFLIAFALAALVFPGAAISQPMEIDYTCGCEKKSERVKHACKGTGSPTVTVRTTVNGKEKAREGAARSLCLRTFKTSCPSVYCNYVLTKGAERTLDKKQSSKKERDPALKNKTGVSDAHAAAFAKFADDKNYTIIVRQGNPKGLTYHDKPLSQYRPKPTALFELNTKKGGKDAGLIVAPSLAVLIQASDPALKKADVDAEVSALELECDDPKVTAENRAKGKCGGWYIDNKNVLRDPKKRAVFGDYDLQGIYDENMKLVDLNDGPPKGGKPGEVNPLRKELNDALSSERSETVDWLVQHGANDNFRVCEKKKAKETTQYCKLDSDCSGGRKCKMGRQSKMDENFVIYDHDGNETYLEGLPALQKFHKDKGMDWLYRCPDDKNDPSCKAASGR